MLKEFEVVSTNFVKKGEHEMQFQRMHYLLWTFYDSKIDFQQILTNSMGETPIGAYYPLHCCLHSVSCSNSICKQETMSNGVKSMHSPTTSGYLGERTELTHYRVVPGAVGRLCLVALYSVGYLVWQSIVFHSLFDVNSIANRQGEIE